jgi:hypothetical protein
MRTQRRKSLEEFFWARVTESGSCWRWGGRKDSFGYGVVQLGRGEPRTGAHRVSWRLHYGEIPPGLCVLHKCDVPECTRPDHLFLGTVGDNVRDAQRKGRLSVPGKGWKRYRIACPNGHPFDVKNTYWHERRSGVARLCRACRALAQRGYKERLSERTLHGG